MVEFVSYSGEYPILCHVELVVKIDDETVNLGKCLCSGGDCGFTDEWEDFVIQGAWEIGKLPETYEKYRKEIEKVANENVPNGCCGGCL